MTSQSTARPFIEQYSALSHAGLLPGGDQDWLRRLRDQGLAQFRALGFPSQSVESWKYTNLRGLEREVFHPATQSTATVGVDTVPSLLAGEAGHRAVFVNGWFRPELSNLGALPDGAELRSLQQELAIDPDFLRRHLGGCVPADVEQPFLALNTALMTDGLVLRVRAGVRVDKPIEAIFLTAPAGESLACHPRTLIVLEDNSEATLVEYHAGLGGGTALANIASEVRVGAGARLHHYKHQDAPEGQYHVHTLHGRLDRDALYDGFGLTTGARLSRNELHLKLDGRGADARLNGAYLQRGRQHCDNTTLIEHAVPDTTCREIFKGAVDDKAKAVFQGKLHVYPDAQRTDGHQLSRGLLLSEEGEIDAKPELEIYADDVKCSHGSTIGELDRLALFYLRSRGLPYRRARRLLVESFLGEVVEEMTLPGVQAAFMARIGDWLDAGAEA